VVHRATSGCDQAERDCGARFKEIRERLKFLVDVGLEYLTLHARAAPLSGGGASAFVGLADRPYWRALRSMSLRSAAPARQCAVAETLKRLRDLGNTAIVEHDEDAIRSADHVLDIGPGAGIHGGHGRKVGRRSIAGAEILYRQYLSASW
jgi:excinuclease ABC subunit A